MPTITENLVTAALTKINAATDLKEIAYLAKPLMEQSLMTVSIMNTIGTKIDSLSATATAKDIAYVLKALEPIAVVPSDLSKTEPYGVVWDDSADVYYKIGHSVPEVQLQMRRCVTSGNPEYAGSLSYYLDANNSALKEDGSAAVVDGSNGLQVRVEVPRHYVSAYKIGSLNYDIISLTQFDGCKTHDRFRLAGWVDSGNGTDAAHEKEFAYLSAFEATRYDHSVTSMVDGTAVAVTLDMTNDKLMSVAGFKPLTTITRATGRTLIANGGSKQYSWHDHDMIKRLFLTEYATHNSQAMIAGYTENTSGPTFDNDVLKTGLTLSLGNNSGSISGSANHLAGGGDGGFNGVVANSYRGIENFFGHLWQWVDGVNFTNAQPFVCDLSGTFADNVFTGDYVRAKDSNVVDITQPTSNGYQSSLQSGTNFIKTIGATSASKVTDYYYYASGSRVLRSGGSLDGGSSAGVSSLAAHSTSSLVYWGLCSRA